LFAALPGIREIRSALAGGYLWILFAWLLLDPSLGKSNFRAGPYQSAHHLGHEVGPVALSVGATFVAYLIGTVFNECRNLFARTYLKTRRTIGQEPESKRAEALARVQQQNRAQRARWEERMKTIVDRLLGETNTPDQLSGDGGNKQDLIEAIVLGVANVLGAVIVLPSVLLRGASLLFFKFLELNEAWAAWILRLVVSARIEPYKPFLSAQGVEAIKRYLSKVARDPSDGPTIADVIADFPVIRNRLIHSSAATVSEIDRLYAEAEFRAAIVLPLAFIGGLVCIEVSWWWAFTAPLLLALAITARARRREAGDLMADALSQGVVKAPSVELALDKDERETREVVAAE
jgi:hypothetical protein